MLCPFLSESQVRSCRVASVRKLIPLSVPSAAGRCATPDFACCEAFQSLQALQNPQHDSVDAGVCPYLQESLMQYCSAAPARRYVPWSEASVCKCGSGAYRYCDLYLDITEASSHRNGSQASEDDLPVPKTLLYSTNHMWLDQAEDGLCHVGIDALFSRLMGPVQRVDFIHLPGSREMDAPATGKHPPTAVLRAGGNDWQITFPRCMNITACNLMLRSDPSRLSADPYGRGWMFAGTGVDPAGLMTGEQAALWMQEDTRRLNEFVQQHTGCCADGGIIEPGLLSTLRREDALALFSGFLSPGSDQFHSPSGAPREMEQHGGDSGVGTK